MNNPQDKEVIKIYSKMAKQLGWAEWKDDDKKAAKIVIDKIKQLQKQVNFPSKLKDTGVSKENFDKNIDVLINLCYQDASSVLTPRSPNSEEYKKLLIYAYEGKDIDF